MTDPYPPRPSTRDAIRWIAPRAAMALVYLSGVTLLCWGFGLFLEWALDWHVTTPAKAAASTGFAIAFTRLVTDIRHGRFL